MSVTLVRCLAYKHFDFKHFLTYIYIIYSYLLLTEQCVLIFSIQFLLIILLHLADNFSLSSGVLNFRRLIVFFAVSYLVFDVEQSMASMAWYTFWRVWIYIAVESNSETRRSLKVTWKEVWQKSGKMVCYASFWWHFDLKLKFEGIFQ